jgi:hypothetical protein
MRAKPRRRHSTTFKYLHRGVTSRANGRQASSPQRGLHRVTNDAMLPPAIRKTRDSLR